MLLVDCPRCGRRLLAASRIRALTNLRAGVIAVTLACHCGHPVTVMTGSAA